MADSSSPRPGAAAVLTSPSWLVIWLNTRLPILLRDANMLDRRLATVLSLDLQQPQSEAHRCRTAPSPVLLPKARQGPGAPSREDGDHPREPLGDAIQQGVCVQLLPVLLSHLLAQPKDEESTSGGSPGRKAGARAPLPRWRSGDKHAVLALTPLLFLGTFVAERWNPGD